MPEVEVISPVGYIISTIVLVDWYYSISTLAEDSTQAGTAKAATMINIDLAFPMYTDMQPILRSNRHAPVSCLNIIDGNLSTGRGIEDSQEA